MRVKKHKFKLLRAAHEHETAEDYVEMIQTLMTEKGEARLTEIARRFGVSNVTAHKIIARLRREGWVQSQPYQAITLTPRGRQLAVRSQRRHEIVYQFLLGLGVPEAIAQVDAEGIEHHVSPETLCILEKRMLKT